MARVLLFSICLIGLSGLTCIASANTAPKAENRAEAQRMLHLLKDPVPEVQLGAVNYWEDHMSDVNSDQPSRQELAARHFLISSLKSLALSASPQPNLAALKLLCRFAGGDHEPELLPRLCAVLSQNEPPPSLCKLAEQALVGLRVRREGSLKSFVGDTNPDVVLGAFFTLPAAQRPQVQAAIHLALKSQNPELRAAAIECFIPIDDDELKRLLFPLTKDPDSGVALLAAHRLHDPDDGYADVQVSRTKKA